MNISRKRLLFLGYLLIAIIFMLLLRLYFLQIMSGEIFAQAASENITRSRATTAPRGNIYDRNGKILVESIPTIAVAVDPYTVLQRDDVISTLSRKLSISYYDLKDKLESSKTTYIDRVIIKQDIDSETLVYLKENSADLPGVEVVNIFSRKYSYQSAASHILGYIGEIDEQKLSQEKYKSGYAGGDMIGLTGVEQQYEDILKGIKGNILYEVDPLGRPTNIIEQNDYASGNDIYLTIDIDLQKYAEEVLNIQLLQIREVLDKNTDVNYRADSGSVVVLNAKTGEVLAMVSYPAYDPGIFTGGISAYDWSMLNDPENLYPLNNRAVMGFPPGSVFKVATAYAGLSEEVINTSSVINCAGTWYGLGTDFPKTCWGVHGGMNIYSALKNSCDIFFYETSLRLYLKNKNQNELLQKYSNLLGLGEKTGIDIPDESPGLIPDKDWKKEYFKNNAANSVWFPGDTVNMSIGQGDVLVTPLQLANIYMLIANKGVQITPHVLKEIKNSAGENFIEIDNKGAIDLELNQDYMNIIEAGLDLVIKQGTGSSAFRTFPLNKISVAGKTGTAEFAGRQDYAWFACYAPIESPEYVVAVMLEEAGGGGRNAAPIAEKILEYLFQVETGERVKMAEDLGD